MVSNLGLMDFVLCVFLVFFPLVYSCCYYCYLSLLGLFIHFFCLFSRERKGKDMELGGRVDGGDLGQAGEETMVRQAVICPWARGATGWRHVCFIDF